MINELTKAVLEKHGVFSIMIDQHDRVGIKFEQELDEKYRYWSFSIANCLIRLLAEDKQ